jgi:Zn-dependent protease with chaperone function
MDLPAQTLAAYYELQRYFNAWWVVSRLVLIGIPTLLGVTSIGGAILRCLSRLLKPWPVAACALYFSVALLVRLIQTTILHHVLAKKCQLEGTPAPSWFGFVAGQLPTILLSALVIAAFGLALIFILERKSRFTWLWLALALTVIITAALALAPYLTETAPLGSSATELNLARLLQRVGTPKEKIRTEDCQAKDDCPPGHVVGIGPTKMILLDRRLTSRTPENQLLQVMAHEAKHFLLDNDFKPVIAIFLICAWVCLATQICVNGLRRRVLGDGARVLLVLPVCGIGFIAFLLAQPAVTTFQCNLELEADRFGLELQRDNSALLEIMRADEKENPMLYRYTLITRYFRATHPQISDRINLAETYKPWRHGEPLKYQQYMSK